MSVDSKWPSKGFLQTSMFLLIRERVLALVALCTLNQHQFTMTQTNYFKNSTEGFLVKTQRLHKLLALPNPSAIFTTKTIQA